MNNFDTISILPGNLAAAGNSLLGNKPHSQREELQKAEYF